MTEKYNSVELQASYGIGLQMGEQLASNPFEGLDIEAVKAGLEDAYTKQTPQLNNEVLGAAFN